MSAFSDDPGHLVRWAADKQQIGDGFLARASYGNYLSEVLAGLQRRAAAAGTGDPPGLAGRGDPA